MYKFIIAKIFIVAALTALLAACGKTTSSSEKIPALTQESKGVANTPRIVGLGDLKIGMTINEFLNISEIKSKVVRDISSQTLDERIDSLSGRGIDKVWKNNNQSKIDGYSKIYTENITDFEFLTELGLSKNEHDTNKVIARFFEDKLIGITVESVGKEFEEILIKKYGVPKNSEDLTVENCQNGYGAKSESLYGMKESIWGEEGGITAVVERLFPGCGRAVIISYIIKNSKTLENVLAIERKAKSDKKDSDLKSKASASKI